MTTKFFNQQPQHSKAKCDQFVKGKGMVANWELSQNLLEKNFTGTAFIADLIKMGSLWFSKEKSQDLNDIFLTKKQKTNITCNFFSVWSPAIKFLHYYIRPVSK